MGLYLSFLSYFTRDEDTCRWDENDGIRPLKRLMELFREIEGYEIKCAVHDFEESINWDMVRENKKSITVLRELYDFLKMEIINIDTFEQVFSLFLLYAPGTNGLMITPKCVNQLVVELNRGYEGKTVVETCCGLSGMGLTFYDRMVKSGKEIVLIGEDSRNLYCDISQIRMFCHGISRPNVLCCDILEQSSWEDNYELVLADLPKGNNEIISTQKVRGMKEWLSFVPNTIFSEWGYIYKILDKLSETGKAFVIATKGALVRERESDLREYIMSNDYLDAVITLPEGLYDGSYLSFELLIFSKSKPKEHCNKVFFADLSEVGERDDNYLSIAQRDIDRLVKAYVDYKQSEPFVVIKTREDIRANAGSWKPYLYLQLRRIQEGWKRQVELQSVAEIMRGAQITKFEEEKLSENPTHYWLNIRNISNSNSIILDEESMISAKSYNWEEKFGIREDDIIITSKGTEIKICIVPPGFPPAFLCGNLTRIRAQGMHPYVLYEFLNSEEGRISLESIQTGTTIKVLNNANLNKLKIPYFEWFEEGKQLKDVYVRYWQEKKKLEYEFEHSRGNILEELKMGGAHE